MYEHILNYSNSRRSRHLQHWRNVSQCDYGFYFLLQDALINTIINFIYQQIELHTADKHTHTPSHGWARHKQTIMHMRQDDSLGDSYVSFWLSDAYRRNAQSDAIISNDLGTFRCQLHRFVRSHTFANCYCWPWQRKPCVPNNRSVNDYFWLMDAPNNSLELWWFSVGESADWIQRERELHFLSIFFFGFAKCFF